MSVPASMRALDWPADRAATAIAELDATMSRVRLHRDDHSARAGSRLGAWTGAQRDMFDRDTDRLVDGADALLRLLAATRRSIVDQAQAVAEENRRRADRRAAWHAAQREAERMAQRARDAGRSSASDRTSGSRSGGPR